MEDFKCKHLVKKDENLRDYTDVNVLPYTVEVDYCELLKKKVNKEKMCKECKLKYCM